MKLLESLKTGWVVWVWNHTPNCAEMSKLASQALDRRLPLRLRLKMRLHYLICRWCQRYAKQLRFLRQAAPRWGEQPGTGAAHALSADGRRRILHRLRNFETRQAGNSL